MHTHTKFKSSLFPKPLLPFGDQSVHDDTFNKISQSDKYWGSFTYLFLMKASLEIDITALAIMPS